MNDKDQRGLFLYFTDGSTLALDFPKHTDNKAAIQLRLDNVLDKRIMLFEVEGQLLVIPFENVKYLRVCPAPAGVDGYTYIKGASAA